MFGGMHVAVLRTSGTLQMTVTPATRSYAAYILVTGAVLPRLAAMSNRGVYRSRNNTMAKMISTITPTAVLMLIATSSLVLIISRRARS